MQNKNDDFWSYQPNHNDDQQEMAESLPIQNPYWNQVSETKIAPKEPFYSPRNIARTGARVAETALGAPGDLLNLPKEAYEYGVEKIRGNPITEDERKEIRKKNFLYSFESVPTSAELKDLTQHYIGDYLKPQSQEEEFSDEVAGFATSLLSPGKLIQTVAKPKAALNIAKQIGGAVAKSFAATGAGNVIEQASGSKGAGQATKLGTATLMGLMSPRGAKGVQNYTSDLYKKAESLIPAGTHLNATDLQHNLQKLKAQLSLGTKAPSEQFIINEVNAALKKMPAGTITPEELTAMKRSLHEKMSQHVYEKPTSKTRAKKLGGYIEKQYNELLDDYAKQNPKWGKAYKEANQAFASTQFLANVKTGVQNYAKKYGLTGFAGAVLGNIAAPSVISGAMIAKTGGAGAATYGALQSARIIYQIAKGGPAMRRYYAQSIAEAAAQNTQALGKSLHKLNEQYKKEYGEPEL